MTDDDFDFDPYRSPEPGPQRVRVSTRKTGPKSVRRDDAAVAEADNARARKPRRRADDETYHYQSEG